MKFMIFSTGEKSDPPSFCLVNKEKKNCSQNLDFDPSNVLNYFYLVFQLETYGEMC